METFAPALPPDIDDVPSAVGLDLPPGPVAGRLYRSPCRRARRTVRALFYADFTGSRRLYACSLSLVDELCDENHASARASRSGWTASPDPGRQWPAYVVSRRKRLAEAHDVLMPGFGFSGLRSYHPAMLDINRQLIALQDPTAGAVGPRLADVAGDPVKPAVDTVGLAGFGARFDSITRTGWPTSRPASRPRSTQIIAPGGATGRPRR